MLMKLTLSISLQHTTGLETNKTQLEKRFLFFEKFLLQIEI